jgi:hypothetical protein
MAHETFYLRSPDEESAQLDVQDALKAAGIDPSLVLEYEHGSIVGWNTTMIAAFGPGDWAKQKATYDDDGNKTQDRIDGDHFILTGRTDDEDLKGVIRSFSSSDPKVDPSEVPDVDKAARGLSRINPPDTPERPIAT